MGWVAQYKDGTIKREGDTFTNEKGELEGVGRPVQDGENGLLKAIAQEDFGHVVEVDLERGRIAITSASNYGTIGFYICEETNIVGDLFHVDQEFVPWYGPVCPYCYHTENTGTKACPNCGKDRAQMIHNGEPVTVRNDHVRPIVWRPIWFTRYTNGVPTKVIGAQTTTPEVEGARNVKKLVMLYADGRIGID